MGHDFSVNDSEVIAMGRDKHELNILESLLIKHYRSKLNNMLCSIPLQLFDGELKFFFVKFITSHNLFSHIFLYNFVCHYKFLAVRSTHNSCENVFVFYTLLRMGIVLPETFNKCCTGAHIIIYEVDSV